MDAGVDVRRVLAIDIPAGLDDELAALATIVALVEPLGSEAQHRVIAWLSARFGKAAW
jgi:hypothetical protein